MARYYNFVQKQPSGATEYWNDPCIDSDGSVILVGEGGNGVTGRLWMSTNSGSTWTEPRPAGDVGFYGFKSAMDSDGSHMLVGMWNARLWRSVNTGAAWNEVQPAGAVNAYWTGCEMDDDGSVMAAFRDNTAGGVYTSTNSGVNWNAAVDPGGATYSDYLLKLDMDSDGSVMIVGSNKRLFKSTNTGVAWTEMQPAGNVDQFWYQVACNSDGSKMIAAYRNNGAKTYYSTNTGANWTEILYTGGISFELQNPKITSDGRILGEYQGRPVHSSDGGSTWSIYECPAGNTTNTYSGYSDMSNDGKYWVLTRYSTSGSYVANNVYLGTYEDKQTFTMDGIIVDMVPAKYWVGGTGAKNWSDAANWSNTDGGAGGAGAPTINQDVYLKSGTSTISVNPSGSYATMKSIDFTGFTGTLSGSSSIIVLGNVTFSTGMTASGYTGAITFTGTNCTLNTNGKTLGCSIVLNTVGGNISLASDLTISGTAPLISLNAGTITTNNYNVSVPGFSANGSTAASLVLGTSSFTTTYTTGFRILNTNFTLSAANSTITVSSSGGSNYFTGAGKTYGNVILTGSNIILIDGANTFNNLTLATTYAGTNYVTLGTLANQIVNGNLTINGTSAVYPTTLRSSSAGTAKKITYYGSLITNTYYSLTADVTLVTFTKNMSVDAVIVAPPVINTVTALTSAGATINWTNYSTLDSIDIETSIDGGANWVINTSGLASSTVTRAITLSSGQSYRVRVVAVNASNGTRYPSAYTSFSTPALATSTFTLDGQIGGTSVTYQVGSSSDDACEEYGASVLTLDGTTLFLQDDATYLRFNSVTLPKGATVLSAFLSFKKDGTKAQGDLVYFDIYGLDEDASTTFSTKTDADARSLTTATTYFETDELITSLNWFHATGIGAIVQEVIDRAGWSSGNPVGFKILTGSGDGAVYSYDSNSANAPKLIVSYTLNQKPMTIDGIKVERKESYVEFSGNRVIERYNALLDFDAIIHTRGTKTFSFDGIVRQTSTIEVTADAITKEINTKTLGFDAGVKAAYTELLSVDGNVFETSVRPVSVNGVVLEQKTTTFSIGGDIATRLLSQYDQDGHIVERKTSGCNVDGVVKSAYTASVGIDMQILDSFTKSFNVLGRIREDISAYIKPGRIGQIKVGFGNELYQIFKGRSKMPKTNIKASRTEMSFFDDVVYLNNYKLPEGVLQSNISTDLYIQGILEEVGYASNDFILDAGLQNITIAQWSGNTAGYEIKKAVEAEGGRFYQREYDGKFIFENRQHYNLDDAHKVSVWHFDYNNLIDLDYPNNVDNIINSVRIILKPRVKQSLQEVWKHGLSSEILSGETITIWANFEDPCSNIADLVATTDYLLNSSADGAGTNMTASVTWTMGKFAKACVMTIKNNAATTGYLTLLRLRAEPYIITGQMTVESIDQDSIDTYGEKLLDIDNEYLTDDHYASALADIIVEKYKDPSHRVILKNRCIPQIQLGDIVTVTNKRNTKSYWMRVMGIAVQYTPTDGMMQDIICREVIASELDSLFTIGISDIEGPYVISA